MDKFNAIDAETRAVLLNKVAEDAHVSVEELLDRAHAMRADFSEKMDLLSALTEEGVSAGPPPAAEIPADELLERRLSVFERALAAMEKRQEKFEQELTRVVAQLEAVRARQSASAPVQKEAPPTIGALRPAADNRVRAFVTHAHAAANAAVHAEAAPSTVHKTPWLAWGGAAAALMLVAAGGFGLILAGQNDSVAAPMPGGGEIHRHVAQNPLGRMMALADNGDAAAQAGLALAYLRGTGVMQDETAAMRWSLAAAAKGQPVAEYLLGTLYLEGNRDPAEAARWFKAAADQGNVKAMHNLAIAYAEGLGVSKDPVQAVSWFVRAAGQGYVDSEFDLAVLYERGAGVPQDAAAALKWYLIAASQGDGPSGQRAEFLKTQLNDAEVKAATDQAAAFTPLPAEKSANEVAAL